MSATVIFGFEPSSFPHETGKAPPRDRLHANEVQAIGNAKIEDPDHVLMGDLPGENQLLLETEQNIGISGQISTNDLERHQTVQFAVPRFIDGPHPTLAEDLQNLIAGIEGRS